MDQNSDTIVYHADGKTVEEFDEKYNAILVSYFNDAFVDDVRKVSKEMKLSEKDAAYVEKLYATPSSSSLSKKNKIKWSVGDYCRAVYDCDLKLYEAVIESIKNGVANIRFIGYGNTQNVPLGMLFLSNGEDAVNKQIEVAENDSIVDYEVKPESGNRFVKRVVKNVKSNTIAKSKQKKKWAFGDICSVLSIEDNSIYRCQIEGIKNDIALVRFFGSDNTHEVPLDSLMENAGEGAIGKQLSTAENETDSQSYNDKEWINGDFCLVYNKRKEVFEEAILCDIIDEVATVATIGYNEKFTVDTNELMESRGPRYRQLQEKEYLKVINGVQENDASNFTRTSGYFDPTPSGTRIDFGTSPMGSNPSQFTRTKTQPAYVPPPFLTPPVANMLQPNTEEEALACMVSSCYLSGYYAGYYASMKKSNQSQL